jgi:hypothetical protein
MNTVPLQAPMEPSMGSGPYWQKKVIRTWDIQSAGLTEIGLPIAGEVIVFFDEPMYVEFEDPTKIGTGKPVKQARYKGKITKFWVRAHLSGSGMGVVVVYYGWPDLGPYFQPDEPDHIQGKLQTILTGANNWGGGQASISSAAITIPYLAGNVPEAYYVYTLEWARQGGTVSTIRFIESVTGSSWPLFSHRLDVPQDRGTLRLPIPCKLAMNGVWTVTGSTEAAATTIDFYVYQTVV